MPIVAGFALKNWKLLAGGIALGFLGIMLIFARADARHWHKVADQTKAAFDQTVANYRAAADEAKRLDAANVARVKTEQTAITERVSHDYEADLVAARARADALRVRLASAADTSGAGKAGLPATSQAASGSDAAPSKDGFSVDDRLIATEQAIQLKALQSWVRSQAAVDVNGAQ